MVVTMSVEVAVEVDVSPRDRRRLEKEYIPTKEAPFPDDDWFAEEKAMCLVEKLVTKPPCYFLGVDAQEVHDGDIMDYHKSLK